MPVGDLIDATVAIPTCDDDPRVLSLLLDAIGRQGVPHPPLIADMSASDRIADLVSRRGEPIRLIRVPPDARVGTSRNLLVATASTRQVLFLDADAVPEPGWALSLTAALRASPNVALVAARVLPTWPRRPPPLFTTTVAQEILGMLDLGPEPGEVARVMGTSFALDRERTPGAAPFRADLGRRPGSLLAGEEVQLSLDVLAAGGRIRYEPRATVHHHVRSERLSWLWMLRRMHAAGRESRRWGQRPEAFSRSLGPRDRVFQALTTPAFQWGRQIGART